MELFKTIDFLGKEPQFYVFQQTRYKTLFGGLISLLAAMAIMSLSIYFIVNALTRKQVNVISSETQEFNRDIPLSSIPILIFPANLKGIVYPDSIAYPVVQYWAYYKENGGNATIVNLNAKKCSMSDVAGYEELFKDFKKLDQHWCWDRPKDLVFFGTFGDIVNGYSKVHAYFSPCTNGSIYNPNHDKNACATPAEIATSLGGTPAHLYTIYVDHVINFQNQTDPFLPYIRTEDLAMTFQNKNTYIYYFKKLFVESDMGFVFEEPVRAESYSGDLNQALTQAGSTFYVPEASGLILFSLNDKASLHLRSYLKFQALVASIGGVANFMLIIAKFITTYVTGKSFFVDIINFRLFQGGPSNPIQGGLDVSINNNSKLRFNNYTQIIPPHVPTINIRNDLAEIASNPPLPTKVKPISLTFTERVLPLMCSRRYKDTYKKIKSYITTKLSVENILRKADEFERMKKFVFTQPELYVFENIDRFRNKLETRIGDRSFDYEDFKKNYLTILSNQKLLDAIRPNE
jgi:hypothetical protein